MAATPNMDTFDAYFRGADLDRDGRISGQEAVAFFQGSNLPKHVLAQIWMHADQNRTGFLGRTEFYNALRLVTVVQSGRELTPDIVKAALYGPAAAKIPAPQINTVNASTAQMNPVATPAAQLKPTMPPPTQMGQMGHVSQMGVLAPNTFQSPPIQGPLAFPLVGGNKQLYPSDSHQMRPPQARPVAARVPVQGPNQIGGNVAGPQIPGSNAPNVSTDWLGGRAIGASVSGSSQISVRGATRIATNQDMLNLAVSSSVPGLTSGPQAQAAVGATSSAPPMPQDLALPSLQPSLQPSSNDSKALVVSGNGFSSDSRFGTVVFSATPQAKDIFPSGSMSNSSGIASLAPGSQSSTKTGQPDLLQSAGVTPSGSNQLQQTQSIIKPGQLNLVQTAASTSNTSNMSAESIRSTSNELQQPWPKMTQSDIQKYTRVFVEVDKDRDGKITGEQARNLFLSWRLPREILKQVWDLSDQDNDSMLSLREFCTALYLMERYREGHALPSVLPNSVKFDETLLRAAGQPSFSYGGAAWQLNPGLSQQGISVQHPVFPATGVRPPLPAPSRTGGPVPLQQNTGAAVANHHTKEQGTMEANSQGVIVAEQNMVPKLEMEILDSKEKIEFYRSKMQELVLYKSRCDNRLNEISERAFADKLEVESLVKKYEEKYKQVGEVMSKLTVEEARFRDVQDRKLELHNAIIKVEQGGSADGLLQVRADRIQSDLEELEKVLNERGKQLGLDVKPTTSVKLPIGWQPGVQEGAVDWDEDWDKFEDEGFTLSNELTVEVENFMANGKPMSPSAWSASEDEDSHVMSSLDTNGKIEKPSGFGEQINENRAAYAQSEEGSAWSPHGSPGRTALGSPSQEFNSPFGMQDVSLHTKESSSDHFGGGSTISDEPSWGVTFDSNDDTDSVWGFNSINTKGNDHERTTSSFFGSEDFGLNPIRVDSPSASSVVGKEKSSFFADSVPSTPLFNSISPPSYNEKPEDRSFDNFSRFDSFNTSDSGFFVQRETLARFDSIRSTRDSDHTRGFPSFDDADAFGSSGPFKSSESHSPTRF